MRSPLPLISGHLARITVASLVAAGIPSGIEAQGIEAQGTVDPLLPAGRFRLEINALFQFADRRFGERFEGGALVREEELLGFDFSDDEVGTRVFPTLEALEAGLETATGSPVAPLVLGAAEMVMTQDAVWVPIRVDLGVFDWLTVGGLAPLSRRRTELAMSFREDGANVGLTPTELTGTFLGDLRTAESDLTARIQLLCSAGPASPECTTASDLLTESQEFEQAIRGAYSSHGVFPLDGSLTGVALQSRLSTLLAAYQSAGVTSFPTAIPLATAVLSEADYLSLVTTPAYGVGGFPVESWLSRWVFGDVELYANARLLASGRSRDDAESAPRISYLLGVGALVRLGTGQTDHPDNFFDTGSGDGQTDLEASVFGSLSGGRWTVHGDARYGIQHSTLVLRRVASPDRAFPGESTRQIVRWTPGKYWQVRLAPRFRINDELALTLDLRRYSKASDAYEPGPAGSTAGLDPEILELETGRTIFEAGGGVVFSTVQSGRPMEARFTYRRAVSGSGGRTPKIFHLEFGLRIFGSLWN